ncbi:MAG: glycosyl transferase, partial [Methanomicrobiales archaeon HGW-Methanomicrobiales-5]
MTVPERQKTQLIDTETSIPDDSSDPGESAKTWRAAPENDLNLTGNLLILMGLTGIGAILRFYGLGTNSLWLDEASTLAFARQSLIGIWESTVGGEFNPPLFYWLEHGMLLFGDSEFVLRLLPALLGVL